MQTLTPQAQFANFGDILTCKSWSSRQSLFACHESEYTTCHDDQYTVTSKSVHATIMTASVLSRMVAPLSVYSLSRVRAFPTSHE